MKEIKNTYCVGSGEIYEQVVRKHEYMVITTREDGKQLAEFAESLDEVDIITAAEAIMLDWDYEVYELDENGKYVPMKSAIERALEEKERKGLIGKILAWIR